MTSGLVASIIVLVVYLLMTTWQVVSARKGTK
jgi:hypothetical protein